MWTLFRDKSEVEEKWAIPITMWDVYQFLTKMRDTVNLKRDYRLSPSVSSSNLNLVNTTDTGDTVRFFKYKSGGRTFMQVTHLDREILVSNNVYVLETEEEMNRRRRRHGKPEIHANDFSDPAWGEF